MWSTPPGVAGVRGVVSHAGVRLPADMAERSGSAGDLTGAFGSGVGADSASRPRGGAGRSGGHSGRRRRVRLGPRGSAQPAGPPSAPARWPPSRRRGGFSTRSTRQPSPSARPLGPHGGPGCGPRGLPRSGITLDLDASLVNVHSDKQEATRTNGLGFGYHPLLVLATRPPRRSPASYEGASASTAADHLGLLDAAVAQLAVTTKADDPDGGVEVLVRADDAGASHSFVDAVVAKGFELSIGSNITEAVRLAVLSVPEDSWQTRCPRTWRTARGRGPRSPPTWTSRRGRRGPGRAAVEKSRTSAPSSTC